MDHSSTTVSSALEAGFDYYVTKPVEPSWLVRLIQAYCRAELELGSRRSTSDQGRWQPRQHACRDASHGPRPFLLGAAALGYCG